VAELRLLGPAAVLVGTLVAAPPTLASCPPYRTTPAPPGSPASGVPEPADGAGRAFLDALRRYSASPLIMTPASGPAPHEIEIRWFTYPYPDVVRFDFDLDGDGTIDASIPMQGEHYPQQRHRLARPGDRTTNVDDVLTSIRLERHGRGYAIYEAVRTDGTITKSFSVRFAIDADGVWRVDSL
jgi:hypothetical protein